MAIIDGDLDFANKTITVERAFSRGVLGETKTAETRTVDMSPNLEVRLKRALTRKKTETLKTSRREIPSWVCYSSTGTALDLYNMAKAFKRVVKKAGLAPGHTLYDLRHSFATNLLASSAPINYVAAMLGHRNPTTTLRWYSHWIPGDREALRRGAGPGWAPIGHRCSGSGGCRKKSP